MIIKKMLQAIVLPVLLLITTIAWSQQTKVTGRVTDAKDGSGLSGASIIVKGTASGVSSDVNGNYSIQAPLNSTLVISSVGFGEKEIVISSDKLNVSLNATAN